MEFLSYSIYNKEKKSKPQIIKLNILALFIIVGILLFAIIIALIIVVFWFNNKNQ